MCDHDSVNKEKFAFDVVIIITTGRNSRAETVEALARLRRYQVERSFVRVPASPDIFPSTRDYDIFLLISVFFRRTSDFQLQLFVPY